MTRETMRKSKISAGICCNNKDKDRYKTAAGTYKYEVVFYELYSISTSHYLKEGIS
jgi:hypothetical protein